MKFCIPDDDPFLLEVYGSTRADELGQVEWAEGQKQIFVRWQFDLQRREYDARRARGSVEAVARRVER